MISGRTLLAWGDLEERRRRRARPRMWALPPLCYAALAGAAAAAAVAVAQQTAALGAGAAERVWVAAAACVFAAVALSGPFRLFWRRDAALLSRLPISGEALFYAAAVRAVRAGARASAAAVVAAAPLAVAGGGAVFLRHAVVAAIAGPAAAALGMAAAVAAGGIVASDRARAVIDSFTGEFRAPATSWLGLLPAVAAAATVLAVIAASGWAQAGGGGGAVLVPAAVPVAAAAAMVWARARAGAIVPPAVREVSALDQERLAHVERSGPSALERAWARLALRQPGARLMFGKDAALARRRYPLAYLVTPLGAVAMWIATATAGAAARAGWTVAVIAALAVYAVTFARRLTEPPTEMAGFLSTLPLRARAVAAAKRAPVALRMLVAVAIGAAPAIARAGDRAALAAGVCGIAGVAVWASRLAVKAPPGSP